MADRPILFSAPMVRALLTGTKTQTRRLLKRPGLLAPPYNLLATEEGVPVSVDDWGVIHYEKPRITRGDRLYVREHWRTTNVLDNTAPRDLRKSETETVDYTPVFFNADGATQSFDPLVDPPFGKHRQAMHMPRWASRLTLSVTDVRVQRLQDITFNDLEAEGIVPIGKTISVDEALAAWRTLWDGINGAGSCESDPWVVAYTFIVQHQNIDRIAA